MAKTFACGDLMPGCDFVAKGETVEEVLAQAGEHAKTAHGLTEIPEDLLKMAKAAIKDA